MKVMLEVTLLLVWLKLQGKNKTFHYVIKKIVIFIKSEKNYTGAIFEFYQTYSEQLENQRQTNSYGTGDQ